MIVKIDKSLCTNCGVCLESCPMEAIVMKDGEVLIVAEMCRGCQVCQMACPNEAIVEDPETTRQRMAAARAQRGW